MLKFRNLYKSGKSANKKIIWNNLISISPLYFSSGPKSNFPESHSEVVQLIFDWVQNNGGQFFDRIGILNNGIFATQKLPAGSNMISVPHKLAFTAENLLSNKGLSCALAKHLPWEAHPADLGANPFRIERSLSDDFYEKSLSSVKERALVALCLMYEYSLGLKSQWGPYLATVPLPPSRTPKSVFIGGPTLSPKHLRDLRGTQAYTDIINMKIDYDSAWNWCKPLIKTLPGHIHRGAFKRGDFDHFMTVAGHQQHSHPPLLNYVQCALVPPMANVEKKIFETFSHLGEQRMVSLHTTRDIEAGEELFLDFGVSMSQAFSRFGFTKIVSPADKFELLMDQMDDTKNPEEMELARISGEVPSGRDVSWDARAESAYEEGKTWEWLSKKCGGDSREMSPGGVNAVAEMDYNYPPTVLVGLAAKVAAENYKPNLTAREKGGHSAKMTKMDTNRMLIDELNIKENLIFSKASEFVQKRLAALSHVDLSADSKELTEIFAKLDEHFKHEFSHFYSDAPKSDSAAKAEAGFGGKKKAWDALTEKQKELVSFYSPPGGEVVDLVRRDVLYLRLIEKVFFQWVALHLERHSLSLDDALLGAPNAADDAKGSFLGALHSLVPSMLWTDLATRWMPKSVAQSLGIISQEEAKRSREMFRLDERWRAESLQKSYEEGMAASIGDSTKKEFLERQQIARAGPSGKSRELKGPKAESEEGSAARRRKQMRRRLRNMGRE